MATKSIDPMRHIISFAGRSLNEGLAEGTFLTIETENAGFEDYAGTDGEVTRVRRHDRRATATLTVVQSSDINEILSDHYESDRAATNGQGVAGFEVRDLDGGTILSASKAWIMDDPNPSFGSGVETREWTFRLADYTPSHKGSPDE